MRSFQFHMPHYRLPHWGMGGGRHDETHTAQRLQRFEGAFDYFMVAAALILAGAMVYGLLNAPGDAPWY